jgi:hypothetical protein
MRSERNPYPSPSPVFFIFMVLLGGAEGLVLYLLRAPLWSFYAAPVLMCPFLVWELVRLDARASGS